MIKNIFIVILLNILNYINNVFIFPFEKHLNAPEGLETMEDILNNEIYTDIKIGTPIQTINAKITFSSSTFYITGISGYQYDPLKSSTYKKENNHENEYYLEDFSKGYISSDSIYFIDYKTKKQTPLTSFFFILPTERKSESSPLKPAQIGFKLYSSTNCEQIMDNLKKKEILKNNVIFIKFSKKQSNGILYIGDFPHNFDKNYYSKNRFYKTKVTYLDHIPSWNILFEEILYDSRTKSKFRQCDFIYDFGGILAPNDYYEYIKNTFFNNLINKGECYENEIKDNYQTFKCKGSAQIKTFKTLIFKSKDLKYNFELNYEDLFLSNKGEYYFLIVFKNNYEPNSWIFGKPFLKKYDFVLDFDRKEIGFYGKSYSISFDSLWIVIFILIIIIIGISYLIYKVSIIKKGKRMVTTELIDNHYFPQD